LNRIAVTWVDLVFLDVRLSDGDGLALAPNLARSNCAPGVILYTSRLDHEFLLRSVESQVFGIIYKTGRFEELETAIRNWEAGIRYFSPAYTEAVRRVLKSPDAYHKILSQTELNLMGKIGLGMSDRQIAAITGLAWSTVRTHRRNIMCKLNIHKSHALVAWAREKGLVA
jgi:DNA-binding NarL/FixJ family response regulator